MVQQLVWTPRQSAPKAFPERQALMPVWGGVPMPCPQWQNIWKKKLPHAADVDALAYLHIPFCANHCVFAASTVMRGRTAKAACTPTKLSRNGR